MSNKDYYSILGVGKSSSIDEIKRAYRKLAMKYHPDRNKGNKETESKFKEINEAYSVLSDSSKKQQYDTFGSVGGNPFGGGGGGFNVDVDLGDIFSSFFGGEFGGKQGRGKRVFKGEDLEYNLNIDLKTSIFGGKDILKFFKLESCHKCNGEGGENKKECSKCNGKGQITFTQNSIFGVIQQTKTCDKCNGSGEEFVSICKECKGEKRIKIKKELEIEIPAGIDNGMIIKMSEEGNNGIGTKASGDLYVKFIVNLEEKGLERKGVDLFYSIDLSVVESILGTKKDINIPIIGKRTVNIKSGTQFGEKIKITGDGVKYIDSEKKGDLILDLQINIPKKLSKKERMLYEQIAKEKKLNVNNKKGVFEKLFG